MNAAIRMGLAVAALVLLQGCLTPAPPDDPRSYGHARWCGTNPPSGYCMVPEPH
ncbi:MAG: hypothetical protein ACREIP_15200 [Alphaproteobacteria bacterium]